MDSFTAKIKELRPALATSSIKTYNNILKNIFYDLNNKDVETNYIYFIENIDAILFHLDKIKPSIRKTYLSALVVISQENIEIQRRYRELMMKDSSEYNAIQKTHIMTDSQKENWISWKEVEDTLGKLKKQYNYLFKEKNPSKEDLYNLQKYIILSVYVLIPPRRALDYTCMKTCLKFDTKTDNYYLKGNFFFNNYKTSKFLGLQYIKVPKQLETLLKNWISLHNNEYLFTQMDGKPFDGGGWTKVLNSIFKKNISVNQLRHIYITEKCNPMIVKLQETANDMAHSTNMQQQYVKIIEPIIESMVGC